MTDYKLIHEMGMAPLRRAMPLRLLERYGWQDAAPKALKPLIARSPFYFELGQELVVASKTETRPELAQQELALAQAALPELTPARAQATGSGVRVQLSLPEIVFGDTYAVLRERGLKDSYMTYRNAIYLRLAQKVSAVMPDLLARLGASAGHLTQPDFATLKSAAATTTVHPIGSVIGHVALMGQELAKRGILGLEIDLPRICAQVPAALTLVRDTMWALLDADAVPDDLDAFLTTALGMNSVPDVFAAPAPVTLPGNTTALVTATLARGGDITVLDLNQGNVWLQVGDRRGLVAGGQPALNTAAAERLNADRYERLRLLGSAGLPIPLGGVYADADALEADWQHGIADKAIVLKARRRGDGLTQTFIAPPTVEELKLAAANIHGDLLIESYKKGDLFRLIVVDGKVVAVLAIDYAYVVGDGRRPVTALLSARNARTGRVITLDAATTTVLADQGVAPDTVLPRGTQAYLGRTSTTLRAGDRRDGRDELDESYHQVAVAAAAACALRFATVDLAVVNSYVPYDEEGEGQVAIVGVQAAPDLTPFAQPDLGAAQSVAGDVLTALLEG